jgi:ABC-type multidrug transport system fused ATPase/permease subunit
MDALDTLSWPLPRLGEALEALARASNLAPRAVEVPLSPGGLAWDSSEALGSWIEATASVLGLEAERVEVPYAEVERLVRSAGPALLSLPSGDGPHFLALLGGRRRVVSVLGPDRIVHRLQPEVIYAALCQGLEPLLAVRVDQLLREANVPKRRQARAREAILRERLSPVRIDGGWLLRLPPSAGIWRQMRQMRLPRHLLRLVGAHTVESLLLLLSWWVVGRGALAGRLDQGWLLAWALLLLTIVPFRLLAMWSQGVLAIGMGGLLKQRLLYGALRLEPEEMRQQGAGQLLGRVIESQAVESLALSGGFLVLGAGIELIMAAVVLGLGGGGALHVLLLFGWVVLALCLNWRYGRYRQHWTVARLGLTHSLIERMVGHRTRLAQEPREHWHDGEDQALERYFVLSRQTDGAAMVQALISAGWLILGLLGLTPLLVSGTSMPGALAVSLGGVLFVARALAQLVTGLSHLMGAAIAWKQVTLFFHAAARPEVSGPPTFALALSPHSGEGKNGQPVLDARDLLFRYHGHVEPVLRACSLQISTGDRILLEGPSGGGKSTLASLLAGLRSPQSGLLLLHGLDWQTLGSEGWRRRVAGAPQFHENYVFTGTFAFNLLMGRRWPAQPEDLQQAEALCHELGLGDLLNRMPAGLQQMVGETGWQLSHGERSRLYIARALLQNADLVVLDESLAALDPENFHQSLHCVLDRASTLLMIAHQ